MDASTLRAWRCQRQGLDGSLEGKPPATVLSQSGWARSVGGANPYLTLFARAGTARESADKSAAELQIQELPSARGCTYVLPAEDFALGLLVGQGFSGATEIATARKLGVEDAEIERLCQKVLDALSEGALDPAKLKEHAGGAVRNLGEEGKKRGLASTLPLALGRLQSSGEIRRVPVNGRLDQQRYAYVRWSPSPLSESKLGRPEAYSELARRYFRWIGPASAANFQWFSGLGVGAAKAAISTLGLVPLEEGSDLLMFPEDRDLLRSFSTPKEPQYRLVGSIDAIALHRRDVESLVDDADGGRPMMGEKGPQSVGGATDLVNHAILDRGRLIGLWEYDQPTGSIAWRSWIPASPELRAEVSRTERFVRDQLGDARSFSLDSPESRAPKIAALREAR